MKMFLSSGSCCPVRSNRVSRALFLALAALGSARLAVGETLVVTASATPAGRTPGLIAYNMGENLPGSNVTSWLRYSEMNGPRFRVSQEAGPADPARGRP